MMMLASLGTMPQTLPLAVASGLIELMLVILTISGLAVAGSVAGRLWREHMRKMHRTGRILTAVRHAMPA